MTVRELYRQLNEKIPPSLSCEWDNDGLLLCPDPERRVSHVLVVLDVTEEIVSWAIAGGVDLILSHHPLIFKGLKAVNEENHIAAKVLRLIRAGISVASFHTRLDALAGGVNDCLASRLRLKDVAPFGSGMGRIGTLAEPMSAEEFAQTVKERLWSPAVTYVEADKPVSRVALLGGAGEDEIFDAIAAGADTYLTGEAKHHTLIDAPEMGINLVVAGHYYTELPVCDALAEMVESLIDDPDLAIEILDATPLRVV